MPEGQQFHDVVRGRRSARSFRSDPVPDALVRAVVDDARYAPSNSNVQPWVVHIASGAIRDKLSQAMLSAAAEERFTPDFPFSYDDLYGVRYFAGRCRPTPLIDVAQPGILRRAARLHAFHGARIRKRARGRRRRHVWPNLPALADGARARWRAADDA
jgi:nitroreductase